MTHSVDEFYGNRLRLRTCGLCLQSDEVLLIKHCMPAGDVWLPPGGGVEFGESVTQCLQREFKEETGLDIRVGEYLFTTEFIHPPLHAIELFFQVQIEGGSLRRGHDPELPEQVIAEARFVPFKDLAQWPSGSLHGVFQKVATPDQVMNLRGYFKL